MFNEALRYDYPLSSASLVLDLGAHRGDFAFGINAKYGCNVNCYEPVTEFYKMCKERFKATDKVCAFKYGLAAFPHTSVFRICGDKTGTFCTEGPEEQVLMLSMADEMASLGNPEVDLLKINIEGGEYELLESLVGTPLINKFRHIQIQFHENVPDWERRQCFIRGHLARTHDNPWHFPKIWESWTRK